MKRQLFQKKKKKDNGNDKKITVSIEKFHEIVVWPAGEFFSSESFTNDFVIAEYDD